MRLQIIESSHGFRQKLLMGLIYAFSLSEVADVARIFMYRPEFFGKPFCNIAQAVLRGPSVWTIGERELFGAFTSKLNHCVY